MAAAQTRLRQAQAFVSVAELVLKEPDDEEPPLRGVAAALAVLAGIAASDAACCARLGKRYRGQDHARSVDLLRTVRPDGEVLARDLERLQAIKDNVHYGALIISLADAKGAVSRARRMVDTVVRVLV
ncbi:MAG: hypothetical protein Q8M74_03965 [Chloroflexota bacterium]|nr:hypothetical protein [Chloroflexota bacterium]